MRNKIEKIILDEVKSTLAEIDIEGQVDELLNKVRVQKLVKEEIDNEIRGKVINVIQESIFKAIHKNQPIIDATIANNVQGLMYGFSDYLKKKST